MSTRNSRLGLILSISTLILAICAHAYLAQIHYNLKFSAPDQASICNVNATFNCAATSASQYSEFFGTELPMAVLGGAANFALLFFLLYFTYFMGTESRLRYYPSLLIYSGGIALVSIVMAFFSSAFLHTYCLVCIFTYLMSFLNFWGITMLKPAGDSGIKWSTKMITPLVVCGLLTLLGSAMVNDSVKKNYGFEDMQNFANSKVQEWSRATEGQIDAKAAITKGAEAQNAKMTIVEFADYLCPHCKHASPIMNAFIGSHSDARLVFAAWPLDGTCNTSIPHGDGTRCALARSVYCADKTKKGWEVHDWIFEHQESFTTLEALDQDLKKMAEEQKLDYAALKTCMDSQEAKSAIEQGAKVGSDLKIEGTPAIFVNGKKLEGGQVLPVLQKAYETIRASSK
jgi:protein-disulfide isomerase/uncharacterized membrane protein